MFTGIIEQVGAVTAVRPLGGGRALIIRAANLAAGMRPGDSLAVNGGCLTVTALSGATLEVEAVSETLSKTTLGALVAGSRVNLERAVPAGGRFDGHYVLGHVDCTTRVLSLERRPESLLAVFALAPEMRRQVVPRGSVALDGVSLTVARLKEDSFTVSLIGYTLAGTTLADLSPGRLVNVRLTLSASMCSARLNAPLGARRA